MTAYHPSKNDDPNGCPDQVMGDCAYACVYCGRDGDAEVERLRACVASAVAPMKRLRELITLHSRDWAFDRRDALLWALLVGWECEGGCEESDDPEHACDGAMRELAERHQWPPQFIDGVRKHRATIRELSHAELRPLPVKEPS